MSATTRRRAHTRREPLEGLQRRVAIITRFHELVRDGHPVTGIQAAIAREMGLNRSTVCRQLQAAGVDLRNECAVAAAWTGERLMKIIEPLADAPFDEALDFEGERIALRPATSPPGCAPIPRCRWSRPRCSTRCPRRPRN